MQDRGAVLKGHFQLSSGRHSDTYIQKFRVLDDPRLTTRLGEALAERFDEGFDVVAAPAVGAIVLGFATALAAGTRSIFAERENGGMTFRRGFHLASGERVVIVEDVITTGGSAAEIVELVSGAGAVPVGVGALIDRGDPCRKELPAPLRALVTLDVDSWTADRCPLCAAGLPLEDPGSRRLRA
ncbi:MAG: orotate phosphoribosyltransferase [Actinomycetota bacterium]|nr:orotate phosphoribosyltransferase [Actinomycetota bacterium]